MNNRVQKEIYIHINNMVQKCMILTTTHHLVLVYHVSISSFPLSILWQNTGLEDFCTPRRLRSLVWTRPNEEDTRSMPAALAHALFSLDMNLIKGRGRSADLLWLFHQTQDGIWAASGRKKEAWKGRVQLEKRWQAWEMKDLCLVSRV